MQSWTGWRVIASAAVVASLGGSAALADEPVTTIEAPLHSVTTLLRLKENSGVTLQWIGWEERGHVIMREQNDAFYLSGGQIDPNGAGTLWLDGEVISSGEDHFIFEGMIRIANTPDTGRFCQETKRWRFAITQNRKYYRLREFEWCDGLTDYIDIYY